MDNYDALLLISFGGPEKREDVIPFLENVLRGKNVPRERMLDVAKHYYHFDGVSPINSQNQAIIAAVKRELTAHGLQLPIYWGNRNWHPLLTDTMRQMRDDGIRRALALVTSAYSSYSGCRQYLEDLSRTRAEIGDGAPQVDKLRVFYNHPGFVNAVVDHVREALDEVPVERHTKTAVIFTAHSIPEAMAKSCQYVAQLNETCRLVIHEIGPFPWHLVYQSRSGTPHVPWLEPDICDFLRDLSTHDEPTDVVIVPVGFVSDHMEILFDLDIEANQMCDQVGLNMVRAKTAGTHPSFVQMIRELILERIDGGPRRALGSMGPSHDVCPEDCCPSGRSIAAKRFGGTRTGGHKI